MSAPEQATNPKVTASAAPEVEAAIEDLDVAQDEVANVSGGVESTAQRTKPVGIRVHPVGPPPPL
jgi:hypothetical protein